LKKTLSLTACVALLLFGCGTTTATTEEALRFAELSKYEQPQIITDTETGCEYLYIKGTHEGGLTILLDENGNPSGCKGLQKSGGEQK